jgi:hypothetical protein
MLDRGELVRHLRTIPANAPSLRAERKQVRGRIEKLLGHIDQLSAG